MRSRAGRLRWPASARSVCLARIVRRFECRVRLCLLLQHRLGRPNGLEPLLAARQFGGQFIAAPIGAIRGIIPDIRSLGLLQQRIDFGLQPRLIRHHPSITHGLVLRRIGLDLGAIQCNVAQLHQPRPLAEL